MHPTAHTSAAGLYSWNGKEAACTQRVMRNEGGDWVEYRVKTNLTTQHCLRRTVPACNDKPVLRKSGRVLADSTAKTTTRYDVGGVESQTAQ